MKNNNVFRAFEFASYNYLNEGKEGKKLPEELYNALRNYSGEKELPYYSLTANGVRFKNYVGALQIGKWTVEVLPKIDREIPEASVQPLLIQMLRQAGMLITHTPSYAELKLKHNYILDAYIQLFLEETRAIVRKGLIKKYRKEEENCFSLKGTLNFNKHVTKNLIHAERFYVRHTIYDKEQILNNILFKTLKLLLSLPLQSKQVLDIRGILLAFPELPDINVSGELFLRLPWSRKTEDYKNAIEIAKLLLLNYHPDLSHGKNHVLALMFDMNEVWEKWVFKQLKAAASKNNGTITIRPQLRKSFWQTCRGSQVYQKPDIVIERNGGKKIILDTKWKLIHDRPSEDDLRQMFAYNRLFNARLSYLVYPGNSGQISGHFYEKNENGECGLSFIRFFIDNKLSGEGIEDFWLSLSRKLEEEMIVLG